MGRFDRLFNAETNSPKSASLLVNSQNSKPANQQTSKEANLQTSKIVNQQTSEPVNSQTSKLANPRNSTTQLSTKEKKKYGTYLREDSILDIRVHAAQTGKKDHEFLQEIVDYYFETTKR